MYVLASSLRGQPIVSLQSGQIVAATGKPIISTHNLEIVAFHCEQPGVRGPFVLLWQDIRQFSPDCLLVNDESELTHPDDLIRLKTSAPHVIDLSGKRVVTDTGRRLGRVTDSTINTETARIQKLLVRWPIWLSWLWPELTIDRTQIVDITPSRIIVRDSTVENPIMGPKVVPDTNA